MAFSKVLISVDGSIWRGYKPVARILASTDQYLFLKAHRHNGAFELKGRKIKILNFKEVANWDRYNKIVAQKKAIESSPERVQKKREYFRAYKALHLEHIREIQMLSQRRMRAKKKALKEAQKN